jgi:hypothetical protein
MRLAALSIFILIAFAAKSLKQVGGADESAGLAAGGKERVLAKTQEQEGATECDYKVCQEQRLAIEDVRDYEAHCAVNHRDVGHTRVIPLAKAPSLRPETGPLPLLREYAEPWLHAFGNVRLTGRKVQLKIKNEEGEVLAGLRLIGG